jgi:type II secretory pathway pseudopilin PulG
MTRRSWFRSEGGFGLVDTLVGLAILATAAVAFLGALGTGSQAAGDLEVDATAQRLMRTQLEYVKGYPYDVDATSYPAVDAPDGYAVTADVSSVAGADQHLQKIIVTVTYNGETQYVAEGFKQNR